MGERTSYTPGTFSWTDLSTSDVDAAKRFYAELFGWDYEDLPVPEGGVYSMALKDGKRVAAIWTPPPGQPTAWNSYVTVENVDATTAEASGLGATVVAQPFDVMDAGRQAVIQDPTGAVFSIWEPRQSIGAGLVNSPGALSLNQLNTNDPDKAQEFYTALFGWRVELTPDTEPPYWGIYQGERLNGGLMELPPDGGAPPHWLVYFGSESADDDARRVAQLGAQTLVPPTDVPGGRFFVAQDAQGAVLGVFSGRFDD